MGARRGGRRNPVNDESSYRGRERERTEVGGDDIKDMYVCMCICTRCVLYAAGRRERKGWHEDFLAESRREKRFAVCTWRITGEEAMYSDKEYLKSG